MNKDSLPMIRGVLGIDAMDCSARKTRPVKMLTALTRIRNMDGFAFQKSCAGKRSNGSRLTNQAATMIPTQIGMLLFIKDAAWRWSLEFANAIPISTPHRMYADHGNRGNQEEFCELKYVASHNGSRSENFTDQKMGDENTIVAAAMDTTRVKMFFFLIRRTASWSSSKVTPTHCSASD